MKVQVLVIMFQGLVTRVDVFHSMGKAEHAFESATGIPYADLEKLDEDYAGSSIWQEELVQ